MSSVTWFIVTNRIKWLLYCVKLRKHCIWASVLSKKYNARFLLRLDQEHCKPKRAITLIFFDVFLPIDFVDKVSLFLTKRILCLWDCSPSLQTAIFTNILTRLSAFMLANAHSSSSYANASRWRRLIFSTKCFHHHWGLYVHTVT